MQLEKFNSILPISLRPLLKIAATLVIISLGYATAKASHIVGGYFRYECVNSTNYRLFLVLYRDCFSGGAMFDSDFDNGAPFLGTVTIYQGVDNIVYDVIQLGTPIVESVPIPANCDSDNLCLERGTYFFEINLPIAAEPYHIVYQRCCRTTSIANINLPGETGATFSISITPAAQSSCNSSPKFINPMMICSNIAQQFSFEHGATDVDGDSIAYSFCAPWAGGGNDQINTDAPNGVAPDPDMPPPFTDVSFIAPPFSASQPIMGAPPFSIQATTGQVNGKPTTLGSFVYGVCANEYRNGQLLSETRFEFIHKVGIPTGTSLISQDAQLHIYPNPSRTGFSLELPPSDGQPFEAQLFDTNGTLKGTWPAVTGFIPTTGLAPGVYMVLLRNGLKTYAERVVVD